MYLRVSMALVAVCLASITQAATLEVPTPNTTVSGIGVISGWKCAAEGDITIRLNGGDPFPATYGLPRLDTRSVCGDDDGNNGFFSYWNWGNLGDGEHTVVAYDSGKEFARSTFRVVTTGEEFLRGASGTCEIPDFPAPGETARFKWNQSTQHLELDAVSRALPTAQGKLYWTNRKRSLQYAVQRANLDGSQLETLFDDRGLYPVDLAVDPSGDKLYWTAGNDDLRAIQWANLDGSQVENLVLWPGPNGGAPRELFVDPTGGKLYWLFWQSGVTEIQRANLDGSQVETLVSHGDPIFHLAVDPTGGKLYWPVETGDFQHAILRANLDGSQVETLLVPDSQLGLGFYLDSTVGKLYWTLNASPRYRQYALQRANLDGSQVETLFVSDSQPRTHDLVVDTIGGKLYWIDSTDIVGEIRRANLDGSEEETSFSIISNYGPLDLVLVWE